MDHFRTMYQFIHFSLIGFDEEMRPCYGCLARADQFRLGEVRWFQRWKQYCFFCAPETLHSHQCLLDIADFLQQLNHEEAK
jgi:hypothetical protein